MRHIPQTFRRHYATHTHTFNLHHVRLNGSISVANSVAPMALESQRLIVARSRSGAERSLLLRRLVPGSQPLRSEGEQLQKGVIFGKGFDGRTTFSRTQTRCLSRELASLSHHVHSRCLLHWAYFIRCEKIHLWAVEGRKRPLWWKLWKWHNNTTQPQIPRVSFSFDNLCRHF